MDPMVYGVYTQQNALKLHFTDHKLYTQQRTKIMFSWITACTRSSMQCLHVHCLHVNMIANLMRTDIHVHIVPVHTYLHISFTYLYTPILAMCIQTGRHTHIQTGRHTHTHMYTHTHASIHAHTHTYTPCTHIHTCTHTHIHTHVCTHASMQTHACMHMYKAYTRHSLTQYT